MVFPLREVPVVLDLSRGRPVARETHHPEICSYRNRQLMLKKWWWDVHGLSNVVYFSEIDDLRGLRALRAAECRWVKGWGLKCWPQVTVHLCQGLRPEIFTAAKRRNWDPDSFHNVPDLMVLASEIHQLGQWNPPVSPVALSISRDVLGIFNISNEEAFRQDTHRVSVLKSYNFCILTVPSMASLGTPAKRASIKAAHAKL